jgi:hypothetical protein
LLITVIVETIGSVYNSKRASIMVMYNYFTVFEVVFYLFVLYHTIQNKTVKQIILCSGIIYPVIAIINIALQKRIAFHFDTYSPGAILLVCLCIFYFYELFKKTVITKPANEPVFWLCLGLLIFYSCTLPITGAFSVVKAPKKFEYYVVGVILSVTNYILYSCFSIAFLCRLKFGANNSHN